MLEPGKAIKVTIYLSEGATHRGVPVYSTILDFLFYRGVAGATVLKGIAGFGADHHMHTASMVEVSDRLPVRIEFIESREKVDALLGKLQELCSSGLIELQETTVVKPAQATKTKNEPPVESLKIEGKAQMMRIYLSEERTWREKPLYHALLEAMRANDIAGATVYRGLAGLGTQDQQKPEKHAHRHRTPILLAAVDSAEKLAAFLPVLERMLDEGTVVFSDVQVMQYERRAPTATVTA